MSNITEQDAKPSGNEALKKALAAKNANKSNQGWRGNGPSASNVKVKSKVSGGTNAPRKGGDR